MQPSKYRPTRATISLKAIGGNLSQVQAGLPKETEVFAVVKADAYGHGVVPVARYLADKVAGFCVSNLDEALELRQAGIELPILVMGPIWIEGVPVAIAEGISLTITSQEWLEQAIGTGLDLTGMHFHVKVDSGMGRIGFRETAELLSSLEMAQEAGAVFEGIFTHFATADEVDDRLFLTQLERFHQVLQVLPALPRWVHASNSATALWHGEAAFNMVRLGNVLYGLNPSGHSLQLPSGIEPALSLTSELVQVKQLASGAKIGYGATYETADREWIGTVPIGYADGVLRRMQGFSVLVEGELCPIVGRVSMDQITIRLPQSFAIGTKVTLIGTNGRQTLTAQDWADKQDTINYEVLCLLSDRVAREYEK